MGTDQIGYLWTQPMAYDEANLRTILSQRVQELRAELEQTQLLLSDTGTAAASPLTSQRFPRLERVRSWAGLASITDAIDAWGQRLQAADLVEQLVRHLTTLPGRDTATRDDLDHPSRWLCFAGVMSCGDEPNGLGYRCMQIIYAADLTDPRDIH